MTYQPSKDPWTPPALDDPELWALKALREGKASGGQQQLALKVIVQKFAAAYDWAYRPGQNDRDTNIALGRQFVGQRIVEAIERPMKPMVPPSGEPDAAGSNPAAAARRNPKPESSRRKPKQA